MGEGASTGRERQAERQTKAEFWCIVSWSAVLKSEQFLQITPKQRPMMVTYAGSAQDHLHWACHVFLPAGPRTSCGQLGQWQRVAGGFVPTVRHSLSTRNGESTSSRLLICIISVVQEKRPTSILRLLKSVQQRKHLDFISTVALYSDTEQIHGDSY